MERFKPTLIWELSKNQGHRYRPQIVGASLCRHSQKGSPIYRNNHLETGFNVALSAPAGSDDNAQCSIVALGLPLLVRWKWAASSRV